MNEYLSEAELEEATIPLLNEFFIHWSFQMSIYQRVIDFAGITSRNIWIGIEYKLSNWKTAIWQAHAHRLTFDYLYILMPKKKISEALERESKKVGIGVLLFNGNRIEVALKPKLQKMIWYPNRQQIKKYMIENPHHSRFEREICDD